MGLDMYLIYDCKIDDEGILSHFQHGEVKPFSLNLGKWRKAPAIHKWFVDNVQNGVDDCGIYDVSLKNLNDLKAICEEVLGKANKLGIDYKDEDEHKKIPAEFASYCYKRLPIAEGSFFGSREYDMYFLYDIKKTIDIINGVYEFLEANWQEDYETHGLLGNLRYHSSW